MAFIPFIVMCIVFVILCVILAGCLYLIRESFKTSEDRKKSLLAQIKKGKDTEFSLRGVDFEEESEIIAYLNKKRIDFKIETDLIEFSVAGYELILKQRKLRLKINHPQQRPNTGKIINFPK